MADNYLEKRMLDMQNTKSGQKKFKPSKKYLEKLREERQKKHEED